MKYRPRVIDKNIEKRLESKGAIVVEGAKWCGKTTTCERHASSVLYLGNTDDQSTQLIKLADISPGILLQGKTPRLIDEWQLAPTLWDAARFEIDHREGFGQFIFTGSATPKSSDAIHHTGTGRFAWLRMRPMSLWESGNSSGEISLEKIFENNIQFAQDKTTLKDLAFMTCRGGWPKSISLSKENSLEQSFDYVDAIVKSDIRRVDGVLRSELRARQLMRVLARHQGTQALDTTICDDMEGKASLKTVKTYMEALDKIFVIEDAPAWNPNLRSKTAIRTSYTHYFTDPSIAAAALDIGPEDLLQDLETFGFIFETLCIRDLRVYAEPLHGTIFHFRTKEGLECDAVIHLRDGRYGLVEIKLGGDKLIEAGAKNLKIIASKLDTQKMKEPSFLMVLAGVAPYAYRRQDGVYVVPIGTLRD